MDTPPLVRAFAYTAQPHPLDTSARSPRPFRVNFPAAGGRVNGPKIASNQSARWERTG